jgi:chorismate mutase / prephenate dehydratase
MDNQLKQHREQIDSIDEQLLTLLNERAQHARAIGALKGDGTIYRPEREAQVLRRLVDKNAGPLSHESITAIFRSIMSNCRALEKKLTVAFLGPLGTFSEEAAIKQFGEMIDSKECASIDQVFNLVESGEADYGVVPVENSTEGAIGRTLDLLTTSEAKICGEITLPVHQHLLSRSTSLSQITKVYSHAQSLAQCHEWLARHLPRVDKHAVSSNAEATRLASLEEGAASIAGLRAAQLFEMNDLANHIEDDSRNTTRFLVLAKHDVAASGQDKTSLLIATKNVPGAMVSILEPLAKNGVSMTKFESRPAKMGLWEYVFFVDIEGHQSDEKVQLSLHEIEARASMVKILGSYPTAIV